MAIRPHGIVSPAVYHASTILYPTYQALKEHKQTYQYGRRGTPTSRSVEAAIATLENGFASKVTPSGLSAITTALLAFLTACCRRENAATEYALLSALFAFSRDIAGAASGFGVERMGYAGFFAFTAALALPALLMLPWLRPQLAAASLVNSPEPATQGASPEDR